MLLQVIDTRLNSTAFVDKNDVEVGLGLLSFVVSNVRSKSLLSSAIPTATVTVVGGSWGTPSPPALYTVTARDTGRNVGFGNGDTLVIVFDQLVQTPSVSTNASLHQLLAFSPSLFDIGGSSTFAVSAWYR